MDKSSSEVEAALAAGMLLAEIQKTESGREYVILPAGSKIESLDNLRECPVRKTGKVSVTTLDSFIRYVQAFGEKPIIFANISAELPSSFVAILDYHEAQQGKPAGWCEHRVTFTATPTVEWQAWRKISNADMSQQAFAEFIENNSGDIVDPNGATMLEIAKTLEAKTSVEFKSGIRLDNGDHQLKYSTQTTGRAGGNGELDIPALFAIGIPVVDGGPAYKINARLRYRISDGRLTLRVKLVDPHKVIEAAFNEMLATLKEATGIEPFRGVA